MTCSTSEKKLGVILEENKGFLAPGQKTVQIYIVQADWEENEYAV